MIEAIGVLFGPNGLDPTSQTADAGLTERATTLLVPTPGRAEHHGLNGGFREPVPPEESGPWGQGPRSRGGRGSTFRPGPPAAGEAGQMHRARRTQSGASAVEFALVSSVLFLLIFGIIQYGLFFS